MGGGRRAIVVTLVGGVAVLLQVRVRVDNQSTRTCQDRMSYRYRSRNVDRRPFRRKKASLRERKQVTCI